MSRSIHTTRRDLEEAHLQRLREGRVEAGEVKRLEEELRRKRIIKRSVGEERGTGDRPEGARVAGMVPIRIQDEGPCICYPATIADFEAVQGRLPPGVTEGLSEVVLALGAEKQLESEREDPCGREADPWTGRLGREFLPGVYTGRVLGDYDGEACRIRVYAYVTDPVHPPALPAVAYLKLRSLTTFVHEVAHHFDHTQRMARGRWLALAGQTEKVERFAECREHEWTQNCVVSHLEETYPREVGELCDWVERHGGVRLPFGKLVPDPRRDVNWLMYFFTVENALQNLSQNVAEGKPLDECRLNFANELHYAEMYDEALLAIERILGEEPDHEGALTLRADIWAHQGKFAEAADLASALIDRNPRNDHARRELMYAFADLEKWDRVIAVATENLQLSTTEFDRMHALFYRCKAYWKTGRKPESDADLVALETDGRRSARWVKRLNEERETAIPATPPAASGPPACGPHGPRPLG